MQNNMFFLIQKKELFTTNQTGGYFIQNGWYFRIIDGIGFYSKRRSFFFQNAEFSGRNKWDFFRYKVGGFLIQNRAH